jgi:hypothetical protein
MPDKDAESRRRGMIYLLIGIIALAIIGPVLVALADDKDNILLFLLGMVSCVVSVAGLIITVILSVSWVGAQYKADIINREFGTEYTRMEVFYASDVIDQVRHLQRKRIELNGDIMRGGQ